MNHDTPVVVSKFTSKSDIRHFSNFAKSTLDPSAEAFSINWPTFRVSNSTVPIVGLRPIRQLSKYQLNMIIL